jgi:hypothetical protein
LALAQAEELGGSYNDLSSQEWENNPRNLNSRRDCLIHNRYGIDEVRRVFCKSAITPCLCEQFSILFRPSPSFHELTKMVLFEKVQLLISRAVQIELAAGERTCKNTSSAIDFIFPCPALSV